MGNRSGKRLPNWLKKARRKERRKEIQRQKQIDRQYERSNAPASVSITPGYLHIHLAIADYIRHYLEAYHTQKSFLTLVPGLNTRSLYVRKPMDNLDILMDVQNIDFHGDQCTISTRLHRKKNPNDLSYPPPTNPMYSMCTWSTKKQKFFYDEQYEYIVPLHFNGIFANPNFFPDLCVFLDKCLFKYWGCSETIILGNLLQTVAIDLERQLQGEWPEWRTKDVRVVEIKKSKGSLDEPSVFDVRMKGLSKGVLYMLDGYVLFQNHQTTIQKTVDWVAGGHTYGFGVLVRKEIRNGYSSSGNPGLHSATQKTE